MAAFRTVCKAAEVPEGEVRLFFLDGQRICVFRMDGEFFAMDDRCPHAGASLAEGIVEDGEVSCRIHHWRFSIRDGACLSDEGPGCDATSLPVRVRGDRVQVRMPPQREEQEP